MYVACYDSCTHDEQDNLLKQAVSYFGSSWKFVAFVLNTDPAVRGRLRSPQQAKDRWVPIAKLASLYLCCISFALFSAQASVHVYSV